jgi:hypothetical protein
MNEVDSRHNEAPTYSYILSIGISSTWEYKNYYDLDVFVRSNCEVTAMVSHKSTAMSHKRMPLTNAWTFYMSDFNSYVYI